MQALQLTTPGLPLVASRSVGVQGFCRPTSASHLSRNSCKQTASACHTSSPSRRSLSGSTWSTKKTPPQLVVHQSGSGVADSEIGGEAPFLRQIGWISFWSQLALAIVSSIIIGFALSGNGPGSAPNPSVWFSLFGVIMSFVTTFMSYGFTRVARKVIYNEGSVRKQNVIASLLRVTSLNLWGLGGTLIGLQSTVGVLVGKTLTSSSTSPYTAAGTRAGAPAALDVFSVQASSNTLLAHFISIVLAQWLLRVLNKGAQPAGQAA